MTITDRDLSGLNLTGANFIGATFSRVTAQGVVLDRADFGLASLDQVDLQGASLLRTDMTHSVMVNGNASGVRARDIDASRANLQGTDLSGGDFTDGNFVGASLSDVNASGGVFIDANLRGANLSGANLDGADFTGADLSLATWTDGRVCQDGSIGECVAGGQPAPSRCILAPYAKCAKVNLSGRDLKGIDLTGADLLEATLDRADATGANFTNIGAVRASMLSIVLDRATLTSANLTNAQLGEGSLRRIAAAGLDASRADVGKADFTMAALDDASFAGANAAEATFTSASLVGVDLSAAALRGADLAQADLTNSVLRSADLRGAKISGATWTGADLSGATWVNGRTCREGSIGRCVLEPLTDEGTILGDGFKWQDALSIFNTGLSISRLIHDCVKNSQKPEATTCWDAGDPNKARFDKLDKSIAELKVEIQKLREESRDSFNLVLKLITDIEANRRLDALLSRVVTANLAMQKYQELVGCTNAIDKGRKTPDGRYFTCTLTNPNGGNPEEFLFEKASDLYQGAGFTANQAAPAQWKPTSAMAFQGPVARLMFATLYTYGDGEQFDTSKIQRAGRDLQAEVAGSGTNSSGSLNAVISAYLAGLRSQQRGTPTGGLPAFVPATMVRDINLQSQYLIASEAAFFGASIAALQLLAGPDATSPWAEALKDQAINGVRDFPNWAIERQLTNFTFPVDGPYSVKVDDTTPVDQTSDRPERIGFVFDPAGGVVYRIQHVFGANDYSSTHPGFDFPAYSSLEGIQRVWTKADVPLSRLQGLYPYILPGGSPAAWFSSYGNGYKVVEVANPRANDAGKTGKSYARYDNYKVPYASPFSSRWGDNVTWAKHAGPCVVPTRMYDVKPSFEKVAQADYRRSTDPHKTPSYQTFHARDSEVAYKRRDKYFRISFEARQMFDTIVTTGAAPAFAVNMDERTYERDEKGYLVDDTLGTGVLWRCGGGRNVDQEAFVPANFVRVNPIRPTKPGADGKGGDGLFWRFVNSGS